MKKEIRLFDYKDREKTIVIDNLRKVKMFIFQIKSGDGILQVIYKNGKIETFDSCDIPRVVDFDDGIWIIEPKDIDVLNRMKNHDDTDELDKICYGV